jgi:hypothetical protein
MIRAASSVDGLARALSDASDEVRSQAAWALGMIRDSRAVGPLSRALKDEDADVREQAAWALGLIARGEDDDMDMDMETPEPNPPNPNLNPGGQDVDNTPEPGSARFVKGASF